MSGTSHPSTNYPNWLFSLETSYNSRNNVTSSSTDNNKNPLQSPLANPPDRKRKASGDETKARSKTSSKETKQSFRGRSNDKNKSKASHTGNKRTVRGATVASVTMSANGGNSAKPAEGIICFRCKKLGHFVKNCPLPPPTDRQNNDNRSIVRNRLNMTNKKQQRREARAARVKETSSARVKATADTQTAEAIDSDNQ